MYGYNSVAIVKIGQRWEATRMTEWRHIAWGGIFNGAAHLKTHAGAHNAINPLFFMR
jgi:hypothetical protein